MMKGLAMIACVSADLGLGKDNNLLWNLPEDMAFFKKTTMGHPVVMGGNTYKSLPHALPGRENIVLSHEKIIDDEVKWFSNKKDLDEYLMALPGEKFVIGGASIYKLFLDEVEKICLTEVDGTKPADTFFPAFDRNDFVRKELAVGKKDNITYKMVSYTRK